MHMGMIELRVGLPEWVDEWLKGVPKSGGGVEDNMRLVVELARENVRHGLGGPFAAAVFAEDGQLVSVGINRVVAEHCSILHAEIIALALAQKRLGRYDLSDGGLRRYELFASTEPCAMCFGAVPWSGVSTLACGARDEDARRIGFDEGPKTEQWAEALRQRGIRVIRDVLRDEARQVLEDYLAAGGVVYNSGLPTLQESATSNQNSG